MRTTLDIDQPVLDQLKLLQKREKWTLSQLASTLLAEALATKGLNIRGNLVPDAPPCRTSSTARSATALHR